MLCGAGELSDRQASNSHAFLVEHDDRTRVKVVGDRVEVDQDQFRDGVCASPVVAPKQEYRWCVVAAAGEEFAEVGIDGDDDPAFTLRPGHDLGVGGVSQTDVPNVDGVVSSIAEEPGEQR